MTAKTPCTRASATESLASNQDLALLQRQLWKQQIRLAEVTRLLKEAREQLDRINGSRSWRITAPLRAVASCLHSWRLGAGDPPGHVKDPSERLHLPTADDRELPRAGANRWLMVDVTELAIEDLRGGIQHVVKGVLGELLLAPPVGWDVVPIRLTRSGYYVDATGPLKEVFGPLGENHEEGRRIVARTGDVFLGLDLVRDHSTLLRQGVASLKQQGAEVHFVVYDLLPVDLPECFPAGIPDRFERWLSVVADLADGVACISATVAQRFARWAASCEARKTLPRMASFRLGIEDREGCVREEVSRERSATVSFLMVGTIEPRKRYGEALDAMERLWSDGADVSLVIVGREGWLSRQLADRIRNHRHYGGRLQWLEFATDENVYEAYRHADCLLLCSLGEGFGLPVVEAASCGVPLVLRDLPELREIAGDAATYFGGRDGQSDLHSVLQQWLDDRAGGAIPSSRNVALISWAQCTKELLNVVGVDSGRRTDSNAALVEKSPGFAARVRTDKKD